MNKFLFFGYGANRDKKRIENILIAAKLTGEDLIVRGGYGARIDGMVLAIQDLDQIPDEAREALLKVWGDTFRSYTLKPGNGQVAGVVWELNEKQYQAIKDWEFDGVWREMVEAEVVTTDQKTLNVTTEKVKDDTSVEKIVDGLNYENNLNKEGTKIAEYAEDEYKIRELHRVREEFARIAVRV